MGQEQAQAFRGLFIAPQRKEVADPAMGMGVAPMDVGDDQRSFAFQIKCPLAVEPEAGAHFNMQHGGGARAV
jgi:hypothetical protein